MKKEAAIKYSIDTINKEDGYIFVKGWGYDNENKMEIEISLIGEEPRGVSFKREQRTDVNQHLGVELEKKLGFEIKFDSSWENKTVKLKLLCGNNYIFNKVKLRKKKINSKMDIKSKAEKNIQKIKWAIDYLEQNGIKRTFARLQTEVFSKNMDPYRYWIEKNEKYDEKKLIKEITGYEKQPKISIILPVYNTDEKWLRECIESVLSQVYTNWELCIADDHSTRSQVQRILSEYAQKDTRIKVVYREKNGHISEASNSALEIATGDYVALLDHDDTLASFALYRIADLINKNVDAEFIYSDEDKINKAGRRSKPFFKPDWSPDTLLSQNYVCHLSVIKSSLIKKAGGFRVGFEGAQDYDLALRCTELTNEIYHIPEILYHWRMIENSTAENPQAKLYAFDAGKNSIEAALVRRNINGTVSMGKNLGTYGVLYKIAGKPKVSIIIPTKDHAKDLEICIESIINKTDYSNYEIIVVDNGSEEIQTFELFEKYARVFGEAFKIVTLDIPFNYSKLNNEAVKLSTGEFLVLMNNDIQVITENWIEKMLGFAQQQHIGAVGAKLYYNDSTIQHAGVVIGVGGVAGHSHKYFNAKNPGYFSRLMIDSNYAAVTAACLMVEKEKYLDVDGLNSINLAVAFNDVDFCLKLLEKGYYNICLSSVECYHHESKSRGVDDTKEKKRRFDKEISYMKEKWKIYIAHDPYYNPNLTLEKEDFSIRKD